MKLGVFFSSILAVVWHICSSHASILQSPLPLEVESELVDKHNLTEVIAASPLLSLHRALCEVTSISGDENTVGNLVVSILEAHNFSVTTQVVPSDGDGNSTKERLNVYAVPKAKAYSELAGENAQAKPKVLLTSHIDTVPPHIPYYLSPPKKSNDRKDIFIGGRGTVDDKACVAAQIITVLELLSSMSDNDIKPSDLALLFVVGEETSGDGMKIFSGSKLYHEQSKDYRAILFGEPTELKLVAGHKGITMIHIDAVGKAAHSGYPWLGRSANSMILPALMVLDKLGDISEDDGGLPRSDKFGKSTVNVGFMQGGLAANVVPEHATAKIAIRLAGGTKEQADKILRKAIEGADPDGLLDVKFLQGYGPVNLDTDVEGFDVITVNYGTDVPNLDVAKGVKRYLYGPGSILVAHGANEGLTVGDLEEAVNGYKKLVLHALKG